MNWWCSFLTQWALLKSSWARNPAASCSNEPPAPCVSFNTCCFTQTLWAKLAYDAGPGMTGMTEGPIPPWLRQRHYEWKWKPLRTRWVTRQSLCPKAPATMDTKHSLCSVCLWVYPRCLARSLDTALPAETLSNMRKDRYCISAVAAGLNHKRPDGCVNLHISAVGWRVSDRIYKTAKANGVKWKGFWKVTHQKVSQTAE